MVNVISKKDKIPDLERNDLVYEFSCPVSQEIWPPRKFGPHFGNLASLRSRRYSRAQGGKLEITACPKTKHFEFFGSWVTERFDWLEHRFEFMIDRKVLLNCVYLRNWNQLVLILEVAS